jgi:hypothetical protein
MKKVVLSVVLCLIAIIGIRAVYNHFTPPTPTPTPCVTTVSPRCPVRQQTVTVTAELFEYGIILQISYYPYALIFPRYGYGYLRTYPDVWSGGLETQEANPDGVRQTQRGLDDQRARLGEVIEAAITYTTQLEIAYGETTPHDDVTYIRLPDGRGIGFDVLSGHWHFVDETP